MDGNPEGRSVRTPIAPADVRGPEETMPHGRDDSAALTGAQFDLLGFFARHEGQEFSVAEIADLCGVGDAEAAGLLKALEDRRCLTRHVSPGEPPRFGISDDGRRRLLGRTPAGG